VELHWLCNINLYMPWQLLTSCITSPSAFGGELTELLLLLPVLLSAPV
jgi:hypothetical protein